jgi:thioredoxin 1
MIKEITSKEFKEVIKDGKVVIDFFATWCGPCKMLSPVMDEISSELKDVNFYKIDVDKNEDVAMEYGIMSIPTIIIFKDGKVVNSIVGLKSKDELISIING